MNICGIICEFNPFHNGHRYLIDSVRRTLGEDCAVVCVMSGDFVQRGEAAVWPKHDRARAAVAGGADLVLELPLPWCLAPAETFARGGVGLLAASGVVTHLAFGSECGELSLLEETVRALFAPELDELIRGGMVDGTPYAAARQRAVERLTGRPASALTQPNDTLAAEYLKALRMQGAGLTPLVVKRLGACHDETAQNAMPSAAFLRERVGAGESLRPWMPEAAFETLEACRPLRSAAIETAVLSRLRFLPESAFSEGPDVSEGLEHRVSRFARTEPTLEDVVSAASGKRYPRARVRRICLAAVLGLRASDGAGLPPYLRVLAADGAGLSLLREMEERAALPVLTKPARVRAMGMRAERVFTLGALAADLCALGERDETRRRGDRDWRASPSIL